MLGIGQHIGQENIVVVALQNFWGSSIQYLPDLANSLSFEAFPNFGDGPVAGHTIHQCLAVRAQLRIGLIV